MSKSEIFNNISNRIMHDTKFLNLYGKLLKHQYQKTRDQSTLDLEEIKYLLKIASLFSNSSMDEFKNISYKIASIISIYYSAQYDQLNKIIQYIIISLGQIPVVKKNIDDGNPDYFSTYSESEEPFNPIKFRDVLYKQINNKIPIELDKKIVYLTDFQSKLYASLSEGNSISISAPTSSGKSFLLKAFISKKFLEKVKLNVVYIVPTRALISETTRDFRNSFKHFGIEEINISSAPSSYSEDQILQKKMFVLTQERYHILLYDTPFKESIDLLIIDEAQKVSEGSRGITLEEVIEESIARYPNLQIIFLTPFSKNPEKFAQMFHLEKLKPEKTKLSPVSQNLFLVDVGDSDYSINLSTAELENTIPISTGYIEDRDKNWFVESKQWKLLWSAAQFGKDLNIVYCNSSEACLTNAQIFANTQTEVHDPEIEDAVRFLKENIHEDYFLIKCLKKGVAYHHGKMPNQIRAIIEHLFMEKNLKYVFCTSTLLEGVNFPAQNIFIFKPRKGKRSMEKLDFWNLAGRAGRLLKDYYGNIYCINIDEWGSFKPDPKDVENEIESILESTFINKNKEIMEYLKDIYFELKQKDKHIEQAVTKFIIQDLKSGKTDFIDEFLKRNPEFKLNQFKAISEEIESISKMISLPSKLLQKNSSIDPRKQQELLDFFEEQEPVIPLRPTSKDSYNNLLSLYKLINNFFMNKFDNSYIFYTFLTWRWINNNSLKDLIKIKVENLRKKTIPTPEMINREIESLFKDLNDTIRFDYQKYLKCYIDILLFYYAKSNYDTKNICDSLPTYLEFGTFNKNVIILQSIGLSRSTSMLLNSFTTGEFSNESDCLKWLRINKMYFRSKISPIYFTEINEVI